MRASVSVRPQRALSVQRPCVLTRMAPSRILSSNHDALEAAKKELQNYIDTLGWPGALLPGSPEIKAKVDLVVSRLEAMSPVPHPVRHGNSVSSTPTYAGPADPLLLGAWELVYASNGTVVTRTAPAQLLLAASQLPGVGIADILQQLDVAPDGSIVTTNQAVFGLGPFGSWQIGIDGVWRDSGDGKTVKVYFNSLSLKMVGLLGLQAPPWLPSLELPASAPKASVSGSGSSQRGAEWVTTYLDDDTRVGRGKTGNTFVFRRKRKLA